MRSIDRKWACLHNKYVKRSLKANILFCLPIILEGVCGSKLNFSFKNWAWHTSIDFTMHFKEGQAFKINKTMRACKSIISVL